MPKNGHSQPQSPRPPAVLKRLDALLGSWDMLLTIPPNPPTILHGSWATFEWMDGGFFLVWRWGPQRPDFPGGGFPSGMALIGYDERADEFSMQYFDSRGVNRIYKMTFGDGFWKMSRESLGFSQRFTGKLSADGSTITSFWEKSLDGVHWEHDFGITLTKAN